MHHALVRCGGSLWLCGLLILPLVSLQAADSSPVGTLRSDGIVLLDGETVRAESLVYPGDQVKTTEGRATISLRHGDLIVLDRHSRAALNRSTQDLTIVVEKGRISVASSGQQALRMEADGLALLPVAKFPSLNEVAMRDDGSLVLSVVRGKVSVEELRPDPVIVSAGQMITISPRLAQAQKSRPVGTGAHGKMTLGEKLRTFRIGSLSHGASVAVVAGVVGAATATAIAVPLTVGQEESPSVP